MKEITKEEYMQMYEIIGAAMHVHEVLHRGLDELIYQEAMEMEFAKRGIKAEPQKLIHCYYEGVQMKKFYQADFYLDGIVVELKSVEHLCSDHRAQLFNYMRLTQTKKGLLINFGETSLRTERYVYDETKDDFILLTQQNLSQHVR